MSRYDEFELDELTDEQWERIATLADKGHSDKLMEHLFEVGSIDPRTAAVFVLAKAEQKRLSAIVDAASEASKEIDPLNRELSMLSRITGDNEYRERMARIDELEAKLAGLRRQQSEAHVHSVHIQGIVRRFPRLFGQKPVEVNGTLHWAPVVDSAPPALHDELHRLYLPTDTINPHEHFPPIQLPLKPRKREPAITGAEQ